MQEVKHPKPSVSDEDGDECIAAESDEEIVDETLRQSLMMNCIRSKSPKAVVSELLLLTASENDEHRPQPRKHNLIVTVQLR